MKAAATGLEQRRSGLDVLQKEVTLGIIIIINNNNNIIIIKLSLYYYYY